MLAARSALQATPTSACSVRRGLSAYSPRLPQTEIPNKYEVMATGSSLDMHPSSTDPQPSPTQPQAQFQPIQTSHPPPPHQDLQAAQQLPSPHHHGGCAPSSQTPGHPSFRRQRASRACEVRLRFSFLERKKSVCAGPGAFMWVVCRCDRLRPAEAPRRSALPIYISARLHLCILIEN